MGSISRPPHRNHASAAALSRKLSNANGFSGQNPYDGVFGGVRKLGAPTFSSMEDYKEIFGSSQGSRASSIPVLDLSSLDEANVSPHFRSSKLDYSKIFDGFRDEEIGVSYEELCALRGGKSSSDEARTPSAAGSTLQRSDHLNCSEQNQVFSSEASDQSSDAVKQFNMSYHKTSQKGKDGTNGTTHVAELRAVPGFTCFIDGIPLQKRENDKPILTKKENDKPKPSAISDVCHKMDSGDGVLEGKNSRKTMKKQTSGGAVKSRSESSCDGTYSNKLFNANEINLKSHPSKAPPPSSLPGEMGNSKGHLKRATVSNFEATKCDAGDSSPLFFDEELDENSAAAVSAAALKKAIEKAQESIRIAKELMERKKEGFQSCSNWSSKYSLKVKDKKEDIIAPEGNITKEKNAKERRERADAVYQNFTGMVRENALKSGEVAPDFKESEKLIIGRKVIGEIHVKSLESAENYETATQFSELLNTGADKHDGEFKEMKTTKETLDQQEGIAEKSEAVKKVNELEYMERKQNAVKMAQDWEENEDKLGAYIVHEHDENEKSGVVQEDEETEEKQKVSYEQVRCEKILEESQEAIEDENKFESQDLKENDNEEKISGALELVENESKEQEVPEQEHIEKRIKDAEKEENEKRQKKIQDEEVIGKKLEEVFQWAENENKLEEACCGESNEKKQKDAHEGEISEKRLDEVHGLEKNEKTPTDAHDGEESENQIKEEYELEENEKSDTVAYIYEGENIQSENDESEENEKIDDEKRSTDAYDGKEIDKKKEVCEWEGNEKRVTGPYRYEEPEYIQRETDESEENEKIEVPEEALYENNFNRVSDACSHDASNSISETEEASISETEETCQHEINDSDVETSPSGSYNNGSTVGVTNVFWEIEVDAAEGVEVAYKLKEKEMFKIAGLVQAAAEYNETGKKVKDASEALPSDGNAAKFGVTEMDIGQKLVEQNNKDSELASNIENGIEILVNESRENEQIFKDDELDEEEEKINPETVHRETQWAENAAELEVSQVRSVSKEREKSIEVDEGIKTSQDTEKNQDNLNKISAMEEMDTKETVSKEVEEKEHLRKIDEANKREREREREREKDRLAVERAIREVRERAFVEARERAERAAVERAKAEVRQRVMAEAREKLEKASEVSKSSAGKASIEAKLRAERAAVERATAEARERALEKALSQKTTSDARPQAERFVAEKFSGTSRDDAMNQSFYSSDSQKFDGMNTESGQRYKARSESHQRIMQRAAKALAEKNMRDVLAQREQAERDRLAETLDADVKRWSSGKEGNLRALLSTLQYILGHGSGWQPVSLTEIITTNAVKKAYRKATLCVHPDKLQQRGASIQQKYICEKVFDLLKAAWNKFNSEER